MGIVVGQSPFDIMWAYVFPSRNEYNQAAPGRKWPVITDRRRQQDSRTIQAPEAQKTE